MRGVLRTIALAIALLASVSASVWASALGAAAAAAAQQSVDYASVSGRVTDASGAVIQGAQVRARHTGTNVTATAATDAEGRFRSPT